MTRAASLIERLPLVTLVVGKGGVGKTTVAAGLAARFAKSGRRTLVLTTDPAGTLADLAAPAGAERGTLAPRPLRDSLDLWVLDAAAYRERFLAQWRETIATIVDRGTYLDRGDIEGLVDAAMPGADEVFGLLALGDVLSSGAYDRIVVDTAPTGHTLRLLELPATFSALVSLLDAMQEKHRFMVRALTHRYKRDPADDFLVEMRGRIDRLAATLADASLTAAILVARDEPVVIAETARYAEALARGGIGIAALVMNAMDDGAAVSPVEPLTRLDSVTIRRRTPPRDIDEAMALVDSATSDGRGQSPTPTAAPTPALTQTPTPTLTPVSRPLVIVAGKGGVGKTTVACAIAIGSADAGRRTLLVSTDPAPSIADALAIPLGDDERAVPGVDGLWARQMDASAAFGRLKAEYESRIDALFGGLIAKGVDLAHDRAIVRELLAFAPPGIDEIFAMSIVGEARAEGRYESIVIDPAPTGHLLRLIDMPALAIDWSHRLMRLMLKYKEVAGLGDAAGELVAFAKRTRALEAALRDPATTEVVEVTLDEPIVRIESQRLLGELRARGIPVGAIVWNRFDARRSEPLEAPGTMQIAAPTAVPVGIEAIRAWAATWRAL